MGDRFRGERPAYLHGFRRNRDSRAGIAGARQGSAPGGTEVGVPSGAVTSSILLTLGLSLLGEALVVGQRAAGRGLAARPTSLVG